MLAGVVVYCGALALFLWAFSVGGRVGSPSPRAAVAVRIGVVTPVARPGGPAGVRVAQEPTRLLSEVSEGGTAPTVDGEGPS